MTKKVYRSAQGKMVDIGALMLQNEHVRAVGNMGVNARGDRITATNRNIESRTSVVQKQHNKAVSTNVIDEPFHSSRKSAIESQRDLEKEYFDNLKQQALAEKKTVTKPAGKKTVEPVAVTEPAVEEISTAVEETNEGGLAAAIARAKQVKQEPLKTSRQLAQEGGVKKI